MIVGLDQREIIQLYDRCSVGSYHRFHTRVFWAILVIKPRPGWNLMNFWYNIKPINSHEKFHDLTHLINTVYLRFTDNSFWNLKWVRLRFALQLTPANTRSTYYKNTYSSDLQLWVFRYTVDPKHLHTVCPRNLGPSSTAQNVSRLLGHTGDILCVGWSVRELSPYNFEKSEKKKEKDKEIRLHPQR